MSKVISLSKATLMPDGIVHTTTAKTTTLGFQVGTSLMVWRLGNGTQLFATDGQKINKFNGTAIVITDIEGKPEDVFEASADDVEKLKISAIDEFSMKARKRVTEGALKNVTTDSKEKANLSLDREVNGCEVITISRSVGLRPAMSLLKAVSSSFPPPPNCSHGLHVKNDSLELGITFLDRDGNMRFQGLIFDDADLHRPFHDLWMELGPMIQSVIEYASKSDEDKLAHELERLEREDIPDVPEKPNVCIDEEPPGCEPFTIPRPTEE
jgi:hypothetical protein